MLWCYPLVQYSLHISHKAAKPMAKPISQSCGNYNWLSASLTTWALVESDKPQKQTTEKAAWATFSINAGIVQLLFDRKVCLAVVYVGAGFSQIQSHRCVFNNYRHTLTNVWGHLVYMFPASSLSWWNRIWWNYWTFYRISIELILFA